MTPPAVSIVCATHGRADRLARLLQALDRPYEVAGPVEVVIVDDGSTDRTPDVLATARPRHVELRCVRLSRNSGPAVARNAGWRAASASHVLFTDDDCVPAEGWLEALHASLATADIAQGRTEPDPAALATRGPFSHTLRTDGTSQRYETCNLAVRRSVLERIGGFDESFRHPYGEDIDLGWRARALGATTTYCPEALVLHDVSLSSYRARLARTRREEGIVQVVQRHPSYRTQLYRRVWAKGSHPLALVVLAGLVLLVVRRDRVGLALALASTAPYLHHRVRVAPLWSRRWWPVTIPLTWVADLLEVGVLVRASWRHRTLVL